MERWAGKIAVVTGASSGIGLEIARALVKNGMIVVGLSLCVDEEEEIVKSVSGSGKFYDQQCDIANENEVKKAFDWVEENLQSVHILVNNAGCSKFATIEDAKTEDLQRVIDVNVIGLLHCTRYAMKIMKKNNHEAHIINMNSIAGHKVPGIVGLNVYPATKFAVTALSETLIHEIAGNKIRVTSSFEKSLNSISPGIVKTKIYETANMDTSFLEVIPTLNPEDVANSVVHVISTPPHVQITELTIKALGQLQ